MRKKNRTNADIPSTIMALKCYRMMTRKHISLCIVIHINYCMGPNWIASRWESTPIEATVWCVTNSHMTNGDEFFFLFTKPKANLNVHILLFSFSFESVKTITILSSALWMIRKTLESHEKLNHNHFLLSKIFNKWWSSGRILPKLMYNHIIDRKWFRTTIWCGSLVEPLDFRFTF